MSYDSVKRVLRGFSASELPACGSQTLLLLTVLISGTNQTTITTNLKLFSEHQQATCLLYLTSLSPMRNFGFEKFWFRGYVIPQTAA